MKGNLIRIGDLFEIEKGSLQSSKNVEGKFDFITAAETWKTHESYTHNCEALVFAAAASGSLGRTHYVNGKFIASDLCFILVPKDLNKYYVDLKFYHFVFNNIRDQIVKATKTGTSKDSINITNFSNYEIPYIKEQSQKIWIDKLKLADEIKIDLFELNDFQVSHLQQLRQAILQEAVQGKLTKQDPNDEPAEKLLQRIKAEKQQLIAAGKLKKEKELPPITEDEAPFESPKGWVWCRLGEIAYSSEAGKSHKCSEREVEGSEWGIIKMSAISSGSFNENENKHYKSVYDDVDKLQIAKGDLLFTRASGSRKLTGVCCQVKSITKNLLLNDKSIRFRFPAHLSVDFISIWNNSFFGREYYDNIMGSKTTTMNNITREQFNNLYLPLPPTSEQKRIVTKLEKLMQMVNELEQQVQQSKEQAGQLLQAVLKEAFNKPAVTKMYEENEVVRMVAEG